MPRYAALLRGVSPMNCKMPALARAFEQAGFAEVRTVLASGNVVFSATGGEAAIARHAEAAMHEGLGRSFFTIVRPIARLQALVDADPFAAFELPPKAKRVVTFLAARQPPAVKLPIEVDGAQLLALEGRELLTAYVPHPTKGAVFMGLIERTFGTEVTTRSWDTVRKLCAAA